MSDKLISILNKFLSSKTGLFLAIVIPIVVIPLPQSIQRIENIVSSNWIQLWALFVLGIMANKQHEHIKKIHNHLGIK